MELMIVIVILGVLVALGLASFTSSQRRSRDSRRKSDLRQTGLALETYIGDKGEYPRDQSGGIKGCGATILCIWGEEWKDSNNTVYMATMPEDPSAGRTYCYDSNGKQYQIYARLENGEDRDILSSIASSDCSGSSACGDGACNYGISSTNITP